MPRVISIAIALRDCKAQALKFRSVRQMPLGVPVVPPL